MAIRNFDAIERQAEMRNKQIETALLLRNQKIDLWIDAIEKSKQSVRDAIDTIQYMNDKGLRDKTETLCKQANLRYSSNGCGCIQLAKDNCCIYLGRADRKYFISIGWGSHGMCEHYDVYKGMSDYTYDTIERDFNGRTYKYLLETTAASLESKLDTFFGLLEKL